MRDVKRIDFTEQTIHILQTYLNEMKFEDVVIMQSTGLKDRNGKEIFEGDILQVGISKWLIQWHTGRAAFWLFSTAEQNTENRIASDGVPARDWNFLNGGAKVYWHELKQQYDVETIGNIYENPELLPNPKP
jgi:uncharacterized phage protein (TIGR01671 family)